ncbi:MAG TPA: PAS domain S-box protein [Flavisolibacter sp.]|nr:PAS domain S-box protein [Flavisolibacter sp.]
MILNGNIVAASPLQPIAQNIFQAFDYIEEAFFFFNTNFEVEYLNRQAREVGKKIYQIQPVLGDSILNYVTPGRRQNFKKVLEKIVQGESASYEIEVEATNVWLHCKYFPSWDEDGCVNGVYGLLKDISAEKEIGRLEEKTVRIEKNLFQSRLLFEEFMQNSPLVSWLTDASGVMHYMNPVYQKTYGFTEKDFGKSIYDLFDAQIATDYHINNQCVLKAGEAIEVIEKGITANGDVQVLKIYKFPLLVNNERMVGGWAADVTGEVELQEKLVKSLERHEYVNEATSDGIYDWNFTTGKIYESCRFKELFGYTEKEVSLRYRLKHIHPDDVESFKKIVFKSLRDTEVNKWEIEYRLQDKDGKFKNVVDKAFIIREQEKVLRVIGALQDISAQKQLQQKLVEQEKKSKRELVKSIIETQEKERRELSVELHDNVNQMLASCKLMLEVAMEAGNNAKMLTEKSYQSIQTVIDEIRRISHDLNPSAIIDVGLAEAIEQLIHKINLAGKIAIQFTSHNKQYKCGLPEEDRVAIFRIVQEQLNNILKHAKAKNVIISLKIEDGLVMLCIKDDGVGFDLAKCRKGLGLRNIYNRVEYYGGTINIKSGAGRGCEMCIMLDTTATAFMRRQLRIA